MNLPFGGCLRSARRAAAWFASASAPRAAAATPASAVRPPTSRLVAAKMFNAVFPAMGVAAPCWTGSVELGRQRQAIEMARVDGDAGGALDGHEGGQGGEEECCSSHGFGPFVLFL